MIQTLEAEKTDDPPQKAKIIIKSRKVSCCGKEYTVGSDHNATCEHCGTVYHYIMSM